MLLYNLIILPDLSERDQYWFRLIKSEFEEYKKINKGPYSLPRFFSKFLQIANTFLDNQNDKKSLWNCKSHIVRYYCPAEITVPEFEKSLFNFKYSPEKIVLLLEDIDDCNDFIYAMEKFHNGYKLYLSNKNLAIMSRMAFGFDVKIHQPYESTY